MSIVTEKKLRPKTILFGFIMAFGSGIGQSYFIAMLIPQFESQFGIGTLQFSNFYAAVTLLSALAFSYFGGWVDKWNLIHILGAICTAVAFATVGLSIGSSWVAFFVCLLIVRFCGQAYFSHLAFNSLSRFYSHNRGRAMSLSGVGFASAEMFWPFFFSRMGWLDNLTQNLPWLGVGYIVLFFSMAFLMRNEKEFVLPPKKQSKDPESPALKVNELRLVGIVKDPFFLSSVPAAILPPAILTGFIIHQDKFASLIRFDVKDIYVYFGFFAAFRILSGLAIGPLIDRFKAVRLFPFYLVPLIASFVCIAFVRSEWLLILVWSLGGLTTGAGAGLKRAMFAEVYPPDQLGRCQSVFSTFIVGGTALGPVYVEAFYTLGFSIVELSIITAFVAVSFSALSLAGCRKVLVHRVTT